MGFRILLAGVAVAFVLVAWPADAATLQAYARVNLVPYTEATLLYTGASTGGATPAQYWPAETGEVAAQEGCFRLDLAGPADCRVSCRIDELTPGTSWAAYPADRSGPVVATYDAGGSLLLELPAPSAACAAGPGSAGGGASAPPPRFLISVEYE